MIRDAFRASLRRAILAGALPFLLALGGCGRPQPPEAGWTVRVSDQMVFAPSTFVCPPGQTLRIRLENTLAARGAALRHNLTILTPGSDAERFGRLATSASADDGYIPEEFRSRIIARTRFVGPSENIEITITSPSQPGDYPVVCAFPGHCLLGMRGTLTIR